METNSTLISNVRTAFGFLKSARDNSIDILAGIIRDAGGFIPTLPTSDKPRLVAYHEFGAGDLDDVTIYGLREHEGEVFLFTKDNLDNYEYENKYCFEYLYDFEGKDLEEINKALSDIANFSSIYDDCVLRSSTIYSILAGLENYL
jgi:hypothetical protein